MSAGTPSRRTSGALRRDSGRREGGPRRGAGSTSERGGERGARPPRETRWQKRAFAGFFFISLELARSELTGPKHLTLSRTDWHLGCERSRSPSADRPVRGRCSPARRQLKPTLGRAIDWHRCSLPQRVQLSGRLPASCLQVAEQRRSCPALDGGGQLWLEEGGRFEAAVARVSFRGCQHPARSPVPCLVRCLPVTCSSSRRVLTPL